MNLSLSLLLTLLFLAPGFAGYFGFSIAISGGFIRRAPPAPNSLTFLVIISFIALLAHGVALFLFAAQDMLCRAGGCIVVGFEPDAYARIFALLKTEGTGIRSAGIFYEMSWLIGLSAVTFHIARIVTRADLRRRERSYAAAYLSRWLGPYVRDVRSGAAVVTGYVLTKIRHDGLALGYRGVISEVSLTSEGELSSITLAAVERFGLRLGPDGQPGERTVVMSRLLGVVHIPGHEIENVVLAVAPFGGAERDGAAGGE